MYRVFNGLLVSTCLGLLSCGPLLQAPQESTAYFVLEESSTPPPECPTTANSVDLLVRDTHSSRFLNSNKIVFSSIPTQRGYYQLAKWVESPPKRFGALLLSRFEQISAFHSVARLGSTALGDYQVNSELLEFYHNTAKRPGSGDLEVSIEVLHLGSRSVIGRKRFQKSADVESYNVEGAVMALSKATDEVIDEIVVWATSTIAKDLAERAE